MCACSTRCVVSACPVNTYKAGTSAEDGCAPCPPHTRTVTEGSTSANQCICEEGYRVDEEQEACVGEYREVRVQGWIQG